MKIIFGLGNPGKEYENTRHNIGFNLLDYILKDINYKNKFDGLYSEININNEKVIIVKPQKYINLSGEVVKKYIDYYKVSLDDILIIHDDLDMRLGTFKFIYNHSSGGHNGIKNIESNLQTQEYLRLKIGISNNKNIDTKNYVLGILDKEEQQKIIQSFNSLKYVIDDFVIYNRNQLMEKYNQIKE